MKIFNTMKKEIDELKPLREGKVGIYFCGMTVQDRPHLGHMRVFLIADILRRFLEYKGYEVTYVQNFTDIDDKIIEKSKREKIDWRKLGETFTEEYLEASDGLNLKRADFYPRATQHIEEIIDLVGALLKKGIAYQAGGSVWFDIEKFENYGKLSKKKIEELLKGARVEPNPNKKNPLDFVLWKGRKEGEPFWYSPWGPGRPGWHIECSAMSTKYLGQPFDIHGGGEDLIFPHHENEIAQSEGARGVPFVKYWLHVGFVKLSGEKMSKSTGHFFAIKDLLREYSANAIRLYLLQTHYRNPLNYDEEALKDAASAYGKIELCLSQFDDLERSKEDFSILEEEIKRFEEAMENDLNTPKALSVVFSLLRDTNDFLSKGEKEEALKRARTLSLILGILGFKKEKREEVHSKELIELIIELRENLRKEKKFSLADRIREKLSSFGILLEDTREGTRWRTFRK